ncbi:MAG: 2-succinyl-6-hydroxy-2,4-cyclohexadiene-carboxylate synthase, partial [Solirubrobacteraceae bacterium]|nr:2-succinyl-6-hydroxy-2,4-cyclohexadiene-carboxylate synthase [Solirubrobacteraceae bacterium]
MLHGFGGTRRAWDGVAKLLDRERYRPLALDLPGHGAQALTAAGPISFAGCVRGVLAHAPERFLLCGYSLGGRVALHAALAAPDRVRGLVLVSSSAGIEDAAERRARREADGRLAAELETRPFEQFIDRWRAQPLFAREPPAVAALARADHLRNSPEALAAALRGIGAGEMEPLWGRLGELRMAVVVLVGGSDPKYRALGRRMVEQLPRGELMVAAGGHGLA